MDRNGEAEQRLREVMLHGVLRYLTKNPIASRVSRFVIWTAITPFSTVSRKLLTFGLPPVLGFVVMFLPIPPLIPILVVFAGFFFIMLSREIYWEGHRRALTTMQNKVQHLVLTEKLLAESFLQFAEKVKSDWHYKSLHAKYWIDEDPLQGRFKRDIRVVLAQKSGPWVACIGRARIGAQGEGTELQPVSELGLAVTCHEPDAYALLLPIELDHDNPAVPERWHVFTILVYAAPSCGPDLHIELSGNWPSLWAPFHATGHDRGTLALDKRCDELTIEVFFPPTTPPNRVKLEEAIPTAQCESCRLDNVENRFHGKIVVTGAERGDYHYSVVSTPSPA